MTLQIKRNFSVACLFMMLLHTEKASGIENTKHVSQHIVQIVQKTKTGDYQFLAGGSLIASGVVLSVLEPEGPFTPDKHFSDIEDEPQDLYIAINIHQNSTQKEIDFIKIDKIRYIRIDQGPTLLNIAVVLFDPKKDWSSSYLPLLEEKDITSFEDLIGEVYTATIAPPQQTIEHSPLALERHHLKLLPNEMRLISGLVSHLLEKIDNHKKTKTLSSQSFQRLKNKQYKRCSEAPNAICIAVTAHSNIPYIGYPVLWKDQKGTLKIIGLAVVYNSLRHGEYDKDKHDMFPAHLIYPYLHLIQLEVLRAHIQSKVPTQVDIKNMFENTMDNSSNHLEYVVNIVGTHVYETLNATVTTEHSCLGSYIDHGVVLTAAHCFDDDPRNTQWNISFKKDGRETTLPLIRYVMHPKYLKSSNISHNSDIALAFFDEKDEFLELQPVQIFRNSHTPLP